LEGTARVNDGDDDDDDGDDDDENDPVGEEEEEEAEGETLLALSEAVQYSIISRIRI
jgi:hypothetical protein